MYSIRVMRPQDIPEVERRHAEQNQRDGTSYPLPQIFDESWRWMPNIALALTVLDGEEIKQGVVFERACEMLLFGCDPKATATLHKQIESAFYLLGQKGYGVVHCFVPKQVVVPVEKPLQKVGFVRDDFRLAHFCKDLTEIEEEAIPNE
jgi:hypothetical protein